MKVPSVILNFCTVLAIPLFLAGLIVAAILASIFGSFNIFEDYISYLGSPAYTPFPWIMNLTFIITSFLIFFYFLNIFNHVYPAVKKNKFKRIYPLFGFLLFIITSISFFLTGIFQSGIFELLHQVFTVLSFVPLIFREIIFGYLTLKLRVFKRYIGYMMFSAHMVTSLLFLIIPAAFVQWLMLFALLTWGVPLSLELVLPKK